MPGISYPFERRIAVAGFVADDDPNVTQPAAPLTYAVEDQEAGADDDNAVRSHSLYFTFEDATGVYKPGGTIDFQTFERDENKAGNPAPANFRWAGLNAEAAAPAASKFNSRAVTNPRVFVRVTALAPPGGATHLRLRATGQV